MNPVNVATSILDAFRGVRAVEVQAEADTASELAAQMVELAGSVPFQRLLQELAPAHDLVYEMWLEGRPVTPEQQAFARLVRLLRARPTALVDMARQILSDARRG